GGAELRASRISQPTSRERSERFGAERAAATGQRLSRQGLNDLRLAAGRSHDDPDTARIGGVLVKCGIGEREPGRGCCELARPTPLVRMNRAKQLTGREVVHLARVGVGKAGSIEAADRRTARSTGAQAFTEGTDTSSYAGDRAEASDYYARFGQTVRPRHSALRPH